MRVCCVCVFVSMGVVVKSAGLLIIRGISMMKACLATTSGESENVHRTRTRAAAAIRIIDRELNCCSRVAHVTPEQQQQVVVVAVSRTRDRQKRAFSFSTILRNVLVDGEPLRLVRCYLF